MAGNRPKLAGITTVYRKYSHTQHIIDRYLEGYGWNGTHHHPEMDLIALYVDQVGADDLSRDRAARFPAMKIYPTIAEALTCGTGKLAVDGVVLVGEHGDYPKTPKGQVQYPRYQFFEQIVAVFRASGRSVPVFNDKHLSWNWEWARKMYDTSKEMGFAFMAGSSLPVTWRIPSVEIPSGAQVREALCICYGGVDSYDFHGLETIQCMVERRQRRRDGREVAASLSRRQVLECLPRQRLAARADECGAVPEPYADARARRVQRHVSRRSTICGGWSRIRWRIATSITTG